MTRCYRKVIRISAEDSPNVQAGLRLVAAGYKPSEKVCLILPGVLSYHEYRKRLETWDAVRSCIGIFGRFWEGAEVLLYPPDWLNRAEQRAMELDLARTVRVAKAIGCDPGEGGANTCWSVVDELGLLEQLSMKTPDTSVIIGWTLQLMKKYGVKAENVVFDRGGGGKQIADELRSRGYNVRTVAFGESVKPEPKIGMRQFGERIDIAEQQYAYVSRRCEMYGELRNLLDPSMGTAEFSATSTGSVFAIPARYTELRHQLSVIPLLYDREGRMRLPPKNKAPGSSRAEKSLVEMIGRSPDESDSLVLAIHAMIHRARRPKAGVS